MTQNKIILLAGVILVIGFLIYFISVIIPVIFGALEPGADIQSGTIFMLIVIIILIGIFGIWKIFSHR